MNGIQTYIISALAGMILCISVLSGCTASSTDRPIVTVTIEPQKYLLEQIAGDKVEIRTLIANGANPETYDPSLTHVMNLNKSIGFLRMGNIGFEAAMLDKIRSENPDLPIFNTSVGVIPVTGTHSHDGKSHKTVDPHTWTSVRNAKIIAANMLAAMTEIDPANKEYYTHNYRRFSQHLDSLDRALETKLAPFSGSAFMVWHPSLSYFARDYGLEQISAGDAHNKELALNQLKESIDHAGRHDAGIFFYQKDFDSRQAETLASQLNLEKVSINPLNYQWEEEITAIADAIVKYGKHQ